MRAGVREEGRGEKLEKKKGVKDEGREKRREEVREEGKHMRRGKG